MDTFILLSILSWHLADFHSVTMPALLLPSSHQSAQDKIRNQNKAIFRSALKVLCKSLLHRSRQEGSVAEDVKDILGGGDEEGLALLDMNAIDMRFTPQTDYHEGGKKAPPQFILRGCGCLASHQYNEIYRLVSIFD